MMPFICRSVEPLSGVDAKEQWKRASLKYSLAWKQDILSLIDVARDRSYQKRRGNQRLGRIKKMYCRLTCCQPRPTSIAQ